MNSTLRAGRKFREHDVVRSLVVIPGDEWGQPVSVGDVGTVVCSFTEPNVAHMVEFSNSDGEALAMPIMTPDQFELVRADES